MAKYRQIYSSAEIKRTYNFQYDLRGEWLGIGRLGKASAVALLQQSSSVGAGCGHTSIIVRIQPRQPPATPASIPDYPSLALLELPRCPTGTSSHGLAQTMPRCWRLQHACALPAAVDPDRRRR
jgi:hypothetical protein